jgi:hypothetical protein
MPEFTTVSLQEAHMRTLAGRGGRYMSEYADYIQQVPHGQAGRLRGGERENPLTIRRRLATAAQRLGIHLTVKRSGQDVYFWREDWEEQPRTKRRYTRRARPAEETTAPEQPISELKDGEHDVPADASPEFEQTPG